MSKIHSINGKPLRPGSLYIQSLFEQESGNVLSKNSLLYHDILCYGEDYQVKNGFRFTDLANWLLKHNIEFLTYYSDSKSHIPFSARIANNRRRLQRLLDNLVELGLVYKRALIKAQKNNEDIPLYDFSLEGHLLLWLIIANDQIKEDIKKQRRVQYKKNHVSITVKELEDKLKNIPPKSAVEKRANHSIYNQKPLMGVQRVLEIVSSYEKVNDSYTLLFIIKLYKKCAGNGTFNKIIDHFMNIVLPQSIFKSGRDMLVAFLGIHQTLNLLLPVPNEFYETLDELDERAKKMVLFELKMEIEQYHSEQSIDEQVFIIQQTNNSYEHNDIVTIPGKEWQEMRFQNIHDPSKVTLPGFCDSCKSDRSFTANIFDYMAAVKFAYGPYPSRSISGKCPQCNSRARTSVMRFPYFVSAWQ